MSRDGLVFVVDDDVSVRRSLGVLIRSVGLESEVFASAQAFLDHPLPDRPCCLVLDLRLPGPSGLDLQLALLKRTRPIPIVFISGHGDVPITARAMKGGAIDFLRKPVPPKALLERIREALRLDAQARDATAQHAELADRIAREPEEGDDRREATGCRASRSGA